MEKDNTNTVIVAVVVVLLILLLFGGFGMMSGFGNYGYGMMGNFFGGFGFMWLFGWVFMILILAALAVFIIWMIKQIQKPDYTSQRNPRRR